MVQPAAFPGVLLLLLSTFTAQAQPEATRGRKVTLSMAPGAPLPEVHVAASVATLLLFDSPIERASVQLDATRLRLVDAGEHSLIIEPRVSPGAQEQWVLRVRYANTVGPEQWAAFALVSRPEQVDLRIEVVRGQQSIEACQAELAAAKAHGEPGNADVWGLADQLGGHAVQAAAFTASWGAASLRAQEGVAYRLATGVLLVLLIQNKTGQPAWAPTEGTLRSTNKTKEAVTVRTVSLRQGPIAPGAVGWVAVEAALPAPAAGRYFELRLGDPSGRVLTLGPMQIPQEQQDNGGRP